MESITEAETKSSTASPTATGRRSPTRLRRTLKSIPSETVVDFGDCGLEAPPLTEVVRGVSGDSKSSGGGGDMEESQSNFTESLDSYATATNSAGPGGRCKRRMPRTSPTGRRFAERSLSPDKNPNLKSSSPSHRRPSAVSSSPSRRSKGGVVVENNRTKDRSSSTSTKEEQVLSSSQGGDTRTTTGDRSRTMAPSQHHIRSHSPSKDFAGCYDPKFAATVHNTKPETRTDTDAGTSSPRTGSPIPTKEGRSGRSSTNSGRSPKSVTAVNNVTRNGEKKSSNSPNASKNTSPVRGSAKNGSSSRTPVNELDQTMSKGKSEHPNSMLRQIPPPPVSMLNNSKSNLDCVQHDKPKRAASILQSKGIKEPPKPKRKSASAAVTNHDTTKSSSKSKNSKSIFKAHETTSHQQQPKSSVIDELIQDDRSVDGLDTFLDRFRELQQQKEDEAATAAAAKALSGDQDTTSARGLFAKMRTLSPVSKRRPTVSAVSSASQQRPAAAQQ